MTLTLVFIGVNSVFYLFFNKSYKTLNIYLYICFVNVLVDSLSLKKFLLSFRE